VHVTSTYYHSWNILFEFKINATYFHRVSDIWCMRSYLVYLTLNIIFSVVDGFSFSTYFCFIVCPLPDVHLFKCCGSLQNTCMAMSNFGEVQSPQISHKRILYIEVVCTGLTTCVYLDFDCVELRATSHTSQESCPWNCESPKEKCPRAVPTHLHNHVVWSRTLKCSMKSYVTRPSTKCRFNEFSIHVSPHTW